MRRIKVLCILCLAILFVGCSNGVNQENGNTETILEHNEEREENVKNTVEKQPAGYYKFNENVLIGYGFEMILKPDGTIIARGRNNNGELGNGSLKDSYEWIEVEGIEDVKQISCAGNGEESTIYALKEDGTVWWWGSEQVRPIQLEGISEVEKLVFKNWGSDDNVDHYSGSVAAHKVDKTVVSISYDQCKEVYDGIQMDDYESIVVQNSEKCFYILDGKLYEYNKANGESVQIEGIDNAKTLIYYYRSNLSLLTESGEVYGYNTATKSWQFLGGKYIEKLYQIYDGDYEYTLTYFKTGSIMTNGDNRWGEVGNGTDEPYKSQSWEVQLPILVDAYSSLNGNAFAIDEENNLWAWGDDYTYDPEIQYNIDDIVAGKFE